MTWRSSRIAPMACGLAASALGGCVTVYQPLVGLQNPVAIAARPDNFKGMRIQLNCLSTDYIDADEAETTCRRVSKLFTNQGATVRTTSGGGPVSEDESELGTPRQARAHPAAKSAADADLEIDLSARELHEENSALLWVLSIGTFTLAPAISETTFAQDVTVRDGSGFLLASDSWQGRFVRYFGAAIWAINFILDHTLRKPQDRLTGDQMAEDFSKDFYAQLTQLVFNARGRWAVLHANEGP